MTEVNTASFVDKDMRLGLTTNSCLTHCDYAAYLLPGNNENGKDFPLGHFRLHLDV